MRGGAKESTQHRYCEVCNEAIARHTRICPYCYYNEAFSLEDASVLSPTDMLDLMRGLVVESQQRGVTRAAMREIVDTFETLYSLVMESFGDNCSVVDAVAMMEVMLNENIARRGRRRAIWLVVCAVVAATILLSSLFALVC